MEESMVKAGQPKHLEIAMNVAQEVIQTFTGLEQYEFLAALKERIESAYLVKIEEAKHKHDSIMKSFDDFKYGDQPRPKPKN